MTESEHLSLTIKWSGTEYVIGDIELSSTVLQLKQQIYKQTGVLPERQKLLGLKYKGNLNIIYAPISRSFGLSNEW